MAPRRPDTAFATNRLPRSLAKPSESDLIASKRLLRYLCGTLDLGLRLRVQDRACTTLTVFSDCVWASDRPTRNSFSQLRCQDTVGDCPVILRGRLHYMLSDPTARVAIGVASRRGLQRIRHLDVRFLWLKAEIATKRVRISNVAGAENVADANIKPSDKHSIDICLSIFGCYADPKTVS